ncbi:MAG: hypothetical protein WAU89_00145 [Candidatus Acidiferrales bacterium]
MRRIVRKGGGRVNRELLPVSGMQYEGGASATDAKLELQRLKPYLSAAATVVAKATTPKDFLTFG